MNPLMLEGLTDVIKSVFNRIWPDPVQQASANLELAKLVQNGELAQMAAEVDLMKGQIEVNKIEAASESFFKSGWRPNIGWICGGALGWNYILRPMLEAGCAMAGHPVTLPPADMTELFPLLLALLGVGTMRSYDKAKALKNGK